MYNLNELIEKEIENGYGDANAQAKVCQDIILKAIASGSLNRNVTIKGGVVMRSKTGNIRRATQDLNIDFVKYSLSDESIDAFIRKLNCLNGIVIVRSGAIEELKQQDYHGKRVYIEVSDELGNQIHSKLDLGVHNRLDIEQEEYCFDIAFDEVRKLDNKKCLIFIRGFDPILDNKYIPFAHPMFDQTADGKGKPYVHEISTNRNLIGPPYEILSKKAVEHYEKLKEKGQNIYIDELKYEEFMLLGETELNHRFTSLEEKEQKDKLNEEQAQELEYAQDAEPEVKQKPDFAPIREKTEWEDTLTNRMLHWNYTEGQKEELQKAVAAKISKAVIMKYFYPDVSVDRMREIRRNNVTMNGS